MRKSTLARQKEALQEIYDTAHLFKDILYMHEVITRIKKLSKAALQKTSTKDTSAIWKMMNWQELR